MQTREQFIRSVIESLGEGLVTLDLDGRVTGWNRAMEQRYRVSAAEVMGQRFLDRFPAYVQEGLTEPLRRLLGGEVEEFTLEALTHGTLGQGQVVQSDWRLSARLARLKSWPHLARWRPASPMS